MSLPDVLRELAERLPERVQLMEDDAPGWSMVRVQAERFWHTVLELFPTGYQPVFRCAEAVLEAALREECEARGWRWKVQRSHADVFDQPYSASTGVDGWSYSGDTPAEALAAAVLAGLKAEKGAG